MTSYLTHILLLSAAPMAARSIPLVGSNPAGRMDFCLL
jgi:hypothetical protein